MTALVTVLSCRYVKGWPRSPDGERAPTQSVSSVLSRSYCTDAHFAAYATSNDRRLVREALDMIPVSMTCVVFDVDCSATHGTPEPAPESWRVEMRTKLSALAEPHPHPYYYETRGGARIVYVQDMPTVLRSQVDAQAWSQDYAIAIAYLARRFGITADPACADWQRLYRLPHATRDTGGEPERWPTIGNVNQIGALTIDATTADVDAARGVSKAFRNRHVLDFAACDSVDGFGLLFHVLKARGYIIRQHSAQAFVIRCPNENAHSTGRTGDGSTVLYLPARGQEVGAIHCLHAHCANMTVRDWVRLFSDAERADATRALGSGRRAS